MTTNEIKAGDKVTFYNDQYIGVVVHVAHGRGEMIRYKCTETLKFSEEWLPAGEAIVTSQRLDEIGNPFASKPCSHAVSVRFLKLAV